MSAFRQHIPRYPRIAGGLALTVAGACLTGAAFFVPAVPFWLALAPLIGGVASGTRRARAVAMALFMLWPVVISAIGLVGTGLDVWFVWSGALAVLIGLAALAAVTGITAATLLLLLVPVFPASPLLPLADALAGLSHPMLWGLGLLGFLAALETGTSLKPRLRAGLLVLALAPIALWHIGILTDLIPHPKTISDKPHAQPDWQVLPVPETVSERTRWILLRDRLPEGGVAVFGENLFDAEDTEALAFWCRAARVQNLTLYIGVSEPHGAARRGAVRRLDVNTCAPGHHRTDMAVYRARFGIPWLTGIWGRMGETVPLFVPAVMQGPLDDGDPDDPHPARTDWLICLEAFLPWAWASVLTDGSDSAARPIVILSNDASFGAFSGAMSTLRHKAGRAMGAFAGRSVLHAETGRAFLLYAPNEGTTP